MVAWCFLQQQNASHNHKSKWTSVGIEAREQAVSLARRSLSYNIAHDVHIRRGDFRQLLDEEERAQLLEGVSSDLDIVQGFDLVTGTPPYFRVDFLVSDSHRSENRAVTSAVISEGAMPSCLQSAPARCEFRGGIEAYCDAASAVLKSTGKFIVCENWINNDRVYAAAKDAKLFVSTVLPIYGRTGKSNPLFAVYTMEKQKAFGLDQATTKKTVSLNPIAVRSENGLHTEEYCRILKYMSIP
jgi:tRNA1(Val) A37 N6-methylase TrmN6